MYQIVKNLEEWDKLLNKSPLLLAYFSSPFCLVCKQVKPQLDKMLKMHFPNLPCIYVNIEMQAEIAAQNTIFNTPTVVVYTEGKEHFKTSRFIRIEKVKHSIERIYKILF